MQQQAEWFHDVQIEQQQAAKFTAWKQQEAEGWKQMALAASGSSGSPAAAEDAEQHAEELRRCGKSLKRSQQQQWQMQQEAQQRQEQRQEEQRRQEQRRRQEQQQEDAEQRRADQRRDYAELWRQQHRLDAAADAAAAAAAADAKKQRLDIAMQQQTGIGTPSHHTKENRQGHVFRRCKDLDYILYII